MQETFDKIDSDKMIEDLADLVVRMHGEEIKTARWLIKNFPLLVRVCAALQFTPEERAAVQQVAEESGDAILRSVMLLEEQLHMAE